VSPPKSLAATNASDGLAATALLAEEEEEEGDGKGEWEAKWEALEGTGEELDEVRFGGSLGESEQEQVANLIETIQGGLGEGRRGGASCWRWVWRRMRTSATEAPWKIGT